MSIKLWGRRRFTKLRTTTIFACVSQPWSTCRWNHHNSSHQTQINHLKKLCSTHTFYYFSHLSKPHNSPHINHLTQKITLHPARVVRHESSDDPDAADVEARLSERGRKLQGLTFAPGSPNSCAESRVHRVFLFYTTSRQQDEEVDPSPPPPLTFF